MKKVLSCVIAFAMILSTMGFVAFASEAVELPTATVTVIENDELTFALNFKADEATEAQLEKYGSWYADFVLTVNKDVVFNADSETADGYLSGQYQAWSENWVNVPFEDVALSAGDSIKIMETAAELLGEKGLKFTYAEVYDIVKDFNCGVKLTDEFLAANPDFYATLELRMYNNEDESESYAIGETYNYAAFDAVASVDGVPYATLEEALLALNPPASTFALRAIPGAKTLKLLKDIEIDYAWDNRNTGAKINVPANIDGNGKTIKFTGLVYDGGNNMSAFRFNAPVSISGLTIDLSEAEYGANMLRAISTNSSLDVSDSTFIGNPDVPKGVAIIFGETGFDPDAEISISGSSFVDWTRRGISDNESGNDVKSVEITDSEFNNADVVVSASEAITLTGNKMEESYINLTAYSNPQNLNVTILDNELEDNDIENGLANQIRLPESATKDVQTGVTIPGTLASELEIKFVATSEKGVYDIVASSYDKINELSTAKLTFVNNSMNNDNTAMGYAISGTDLYNYLIENENTYTFYAINGADLTNDKQEVTLGQVKFSGFGEIDFEVDATADNNVVVKTIKDNAEFVYSANGGVDANSGKLVIDTDAVIDEAIKPEMAELTIEVDYVHDVAEVAKAYQNMTIEITGLDLLGEVITIDLGNDQADFDYDYVECADYTAESKVAHHKSIVKVADKLIKGNTYNVKIYGDGYRTAEYTIRMDDNKTMKFWNNVMSAATKVEVADDAATDVNFLAGDIFEDEIINVYDLSAIVSYFGENPRTNAAYVQYDLNRDGLINGIDISILLNSWYK